MKIPGSHIRCPKTAHFCHLPGPTICFSQLPVDESLELFHLLYHKTGQENWQVFVNLPILADGQSECSNEIRFGDGESRSNEPQRSNETLFPKD